MSSGSRFDAGGCEGRLAPDGLLANDASELPVIRSGNSAGLLAPRIIGMAGLLVDRIIGMAGLLVDRIIGMAGLLVDRIIGMAGLLVDRTIGIAGLDARGIPSVSGPPTAELAPSGKRTSSAVPSAL